MVKQDGHNEQPVDTTISFKIDDIWGSPKPDFEFNTLVKASNDTLDLVSCSKYFVSLFGEINNKSELKSSLLQKFN